MPGRWGRSRNVIEPGNFVIRESTRGILLAGTGVRRSHAFNCRFGGNGFANLFFTALGIVPPGSPFFPASYHSGGKPAFAFATEAASLAVQAFKDQGNLTEGIKSLVSEIKKHTIALEKAGLEIERKTGAKFLGIDFSLAPFPDDFSSIGAAIESIMIPLYAFSACVHFRRITQP